MFLNFFTPGWRTLLRNKGYTTINVLGLALGISSCLVIFLIASYELSYDRFHPNRDRIYRVVGASQFKNEAVRKKGYVPSPVPMAVREQVSGLEQVTGFYNYYASVSVPQAGKEVKVFEVVRDQPSPVIVAEPSFFSIFSYQWLAGNPATALTAPFKVVLTEKAAARYFGKQPAASLIGHELYYNDSLHVQVAGIVRDWTANTNFGFTDFISFASVQHSFLKENIDMNAWGMWDYYSQAFVQLAPGTTPRQINDRLARLAKDNMPGKGNQLELQPLADIHYNEDFADGYARKVHLPTLYGLIGIALFILLIAVINFVNLSTAQSITRAKEIGVRKVLGSGRRRLLLQFFGETFLITLAALILSVILLKPILGAFDDYIPAGVLVNPFTTTTWLILAIILLATTLLAGFYPAGVIAAFKPVTSLKGQPSTTVHGKQYLRKSLIVFQFTVSLIFIIGTLVVGKQIHYMLNTDLGFEHDAIINLRPGREASPASKQLLAQQLLQLPGVKAVSIHGETPAAKRHGGTSIKTIGSQLSDNEIISSFGYADPQYLSLYQIKLLAGRNLLPSDTLREFVINATCARALGYNTPDKAIGQLAEVGISGKKGPIIGVMDDYHAKSFHEAIPAFFLTTDAKASRTISVKLASSQQQLGEVKNILAAIESKWTAVYPDKKPSLTFFDETLAALYEKEQKTARLMNTAMGMAIFISCIGLLGLATFTMQQRAKEIGIRKVLGATVGNITSMLTKEFVQLVIIATLIAAPVAWYFMHSWLEEFAYRTAISWWIMVLAGILATAITLCTIGIQAIRAAMTNPVKSLRNE